jgi:hypothetical protein
MKPINHFGFNPKNYRILFIGIGLNVLGFALMIGGGSDDPNVFNGNELFSPIRITLAPLFIVAGYVFTLVAVMKKDKTAVTQIEKIVEEEAPVKEVKKKNQK